MPIQDIIQNKNLHKTIVPPPPGSLIIQELSPQELLLEVPKSKEFFIKKHKKAIIAVSATVLAAAVLGVVAFFAWPAVASAILGVGIYGLTLGALAGANLIAQVGLVAAVFAVGGFIASGGLLTTGSMVINGIRKAWNTFYESPVETQANFIPQSDPTMNIAKELSQNGGGIKKPSPLSLVVPPTAPVVPSTDSGIFLTQMQQKKEKLKRLVEINNQLINDDTLSDNEYAQLNDEFKNLEKDIQAGQSNLQKEERPSSDFSNEFKDKYHRIISSDESLTSELSALKVI